LALLLGAAAAAPAGQGSEALQRLLVVMVIVSNTPTGLIRDFPSGSSQDRVHGYKTRAGEIGEF